MTPRPPALETAEARGAVEVWAMPARRMGWRMERRVVRGVVIVGTGADEAIIWVRGIGIIGRVKEESEEWEGVGMALKTYANVRSAAC